MMTWNASLARAGERGARPPVPAAAVNAAAYGSSNRRSGRRLSHARARATPSDVTPTPFSGFMGLPSYDHKMHRHRCICTDVSSHGMDGVRMHRLGKRLIDLSREVTTSAGDAALTPAEVAVVVDVLKHPGSAVSEIKVRTGFAQSHVSESVARLKERGLIETPPDAEDRRRTRVGLSEPARRAVLARAGRSADDVLARVVDDAARVTALLDGLADLLL